MAETRTRTQDPKQTGPRPPFPGQRQPPPGSEAAMQPKVDHGVQSYRGSGKLTGKAALITGADSGIGRAVALAFAREGADVLIAYLSEDRDAAETARLVEEAGRRAVRAGGDLRDEGHCRGLVDRAYDQFGRLDLLVNNAAYQMTRERIDDLSAEQFERTYRTNVFAVFYLCKAALPRMQGLPLHWLCLHPSRRFASGGVAARGLTPRSISPAGDGRRWPRSIARARAGSPRRG